MEIPFPAYRGKEPFVFVCYAHADAELVYPEISHLHEEGVQVYYDEGISPGHEWTQELADAIDASSHFLFFVSPSSVASRHCRNEVRYALDEGKLVNSVYLEPTTLPGGLKLSLGSDQAILKYDLSAKDYERKIFEALRKPHVPKDAKVADKSTNEAKRSRRWPILGPVLVIAALAIGLVLFKSSEVTTWLVVNAPRVLADPVEQQISFAETSDGIRIAYATSGAGDPLVLTNGFATHLTEGLGSPLYDEGDFLRWWSRDRLTVRYDGRGFGLSERDVDDFSLDARVADLEAVVNALGLERFALYGYSAGGPTAVGYAARHPERVSHLVLAATFAAATDTVSFQAAVDLANFVTSNWDNPTARGAIAEGLAPEASQFERPIVMHFLKVAGDGPQIGGFIRATWELDVADSARKIRVPTLVVAGDADPVVPLDASRRLASLVPGARLEVLDGGITHSEAAASDPRLLQMVAAFLATGRH